MAAKPKENETNVKITAQMIPVEKDRETIRRTVLTNIIKMLAYRKWLTNEVVDSTTADLLANKSDDGTYKIKLTTDLATNALYRYVKPVENTKTKTKEKEDASKKPKPEQFNGKHLVVKLTELTISGLAKSPDVMDFMTSNSKYHKILIVDTISEKPRKQLTKDKMCEVFNENFFMFNLVDHVASPAYEVLDIEENILFREKLKSEEETIENLKISEQQEILEAYQVRRTELNKMKEDDKAAMYLFVRHKDIVRVIRNSELCGYKISYSVVV